MEGLDMTPPQVLKVPKRVSDFVDEIDDTYIRTKLQQLIAVYEEPDLSFEKQVELVENATALWQLAVANQHNSIDRLINERTRHLMEIAQLKGELNAMSKLLDKGKVGPE